MTSGSSQILVDASGRRRRVLRRFGRVVSVAMLLWLGLLALGTLGLQPLGQLPVLGQAQPGSSAPALPPRIEGMASRSAGPSPGRGAAAIETTRGRLVTSGRERVPIPTRDRPSRVEGDSKLSPARQGTFGTTSHQPATLAPSGAAATGATSAPLSQSTRLPPGRSGGEHGSSTSSPGRTDSSPGHVKPDGAPASPPVATDPPVPTDPGRSAEHPPQGPGPSMTVPSP
jgi:hypothetical protein